MESRTGFTYHKLPFLVFTTSACLLLVLKDRSASVKVLALLTVAGVPILVWKQGFNRSKAIPEIMGIAAGLGRIDSVLTLSTHVYTGPPVALALGADWASSYPANWLVPGAINQLAVADCKTEVDQCVRLTAIIARNRSGNISDLTGRKPDLLIVDLNSGYFDAPHFDWLAFMAQDPSWQAALPPTTRSRSPGASFTFSAIPDKKTPP